MARRSSTVTSPSVTRLCSTGRKASIFSGTSMITIATGRSGDQDRTLLTCTCLDAP
jgi:hypothetical protein